MNRLSSLLYFCLQGLALFSNKYVLSVLGFKFPMVFQGWQMLVGFLLYKLFYVTAVLPPATKMDSPGAVSLLPSFLLFTTAIISGSKALSMLPVITFVAVTNLVPVVVLAADQWQQRQQQKLSSSSSSLSSPPSLTLRHVVASLAVVISSAALLFLHGSGGEARPFYDTGTGHFWLLLHVFVSCLYALHGRIADVRFHAVDRQYYSYIFALVVLAPASLYLEEAFAALRFRQLRQLMFIAGSLLGAVAGVVLHLYQSRLRNDANFGRVHHLGLLLTGLASLAVFDMEFDSWFALPTALTSLAAIVFLPTHILPEEEKLETASISTLNV